MTREHIEDVQTLHIIISIHVHFNFVYGPKQNLLKPLHAYRKPPIYVQDNFVYSEPMLCNLYVLHHRCKLENFRIINKLL